MSNHDKRCPYCGETEKSTSHILDCQPFEITTE